jgi:hypothetical protein
MDREVISDNGEVTLYSSELSRRRFLGLSGAAVAGLSAAAVPKARARNGGRATSC